MLARKVALGSLMLGGAQLLVKGLDLVMLAIVARILVPEDFGLVALAASTMIVLASFTELPVADALIQRETLESRDVDAAFTLTFLRGALVASAMIALAMPAAAFYDDPRLAPMIGLLAVSPLATGLASPAMVRFAREVNYLPSAALQVVAKLLSFVVTTAVAVATQSYWALIVGMITAPMLVSAASYIVAPYRPRFSLTGTRSLVSFAGWVTISRVVFTLNQHADRFFIGSILGRPTLGQYAVGSDVSSTATYALAGPLTNALFAGFARIRHDMNRLRSAFLRGQQVMVTGILPLGIGLSVLAEPVIRLLLGDGWTEAVVVVQWLAPVVALQVTISGVHSISLAIGQPRVLVLRELIALVLRLPPTILAAWYWGLEGAVIARALSGIVIVAINMEIASRLIEVRMIDQITNNWRSYVSAAVMAAGIVALPALYTNHILTSGHAVSYLFGQILFGAVLYAACQLLLWVASGRPEGAESFFLGAIAAVARRARRQSNTIGIKTEQFDR